MGPVLSSRTDATSMGYLKAWVEGRAQAGSPVFADVRVQLRCPAGCASVPASWCRLSLCLLPAPQTPSQRQPLPQHPLRGPHRPASPSPACHHHHPPLLQVRDVARAHVLAAEIPDASGRYIVAASHSTPAALISGWLQVGVCVCVVVVVGWGAGGGGGGGGGGPAGAGGRGRGGGGQGAAAAVWRQQEAAGGRWELQRLERGLQGWLTAEGLKEAGLQATASQLSRCLQGQLPTRRSGAAATPGRHPTGSCHSTAPPAPHAHAVPCVLAPTHLTRSASLSVPLRPARLGSRKRKTATAGCR